MSRAQAVCLLTTLTTSLLSGCSGCRGEATTGGTIDDAGETVEMVQSRDASVVKSKMAIWDDLLHSTDARLAVSSKVENPHDYPEHIADGRLDTAWNGKTGDLVGGWFGFAVPEAARVRAIDLVVGFDARSKKGEDLFLDNHRITRVRVVRNGKPLVEHHFAPDDRRFQRIAVDAPGGEFRIEVLEVKPGRRKDWRELVVSELRVLGVAGSAARGVTLMPHVAVGSFDAPPPDPVLTKTNAFDEIAPSVEGMCAGFAANEQPALERVRKEIETGKRFSRETELKCEATELFEKGNVKLLLFDQTGATDMVKRLAASYDGQIYMLPTSVVTRHDLWDPCPHESHNAIIDKTRLEPGNGTGRVAVVTVYRWTKSDDMFDMSLEGDPKVNSGSSTRELTEVRCVLAPTRPSCSERTIAQRDGHEDLAALEVIPPLPW